MFGYSKKPAVSISSLFLRLERTWTIVGDNRVVVIGGTLFSELRAQKSRTQAIQK